MRRRRFLRDTCGATAVLFAVASIPMMGMLGMVVDIGNVFSAKRRLQGVADLAAIAAATDLGHATLAAQATASDNVYTAADVARVETGIYTADPNVTPSSRFQTASASSANAVRVTMTHQQPLFFSPAFTMAGHGTGAAPNTEAISSQAIATNGNAAEFSIGSRVASFNGGILNGLLSSLLGGSVNLSAADYNNLLSANVDLFQLADNIAAQAGQVGGTYKQAVSGTISLSQFIGVLGALAPAAGSALQQLQTAAGSGSGIVDLPQLLSFGPFGNMSVAAAEPNIAASASVLSLLQAAAAAGGAAHLANLAVAANIPGIASVTGMVSLGEPAQNSAIIAVDQVGSVVHTAQARLYLNISLVGTPPFSLVQLPLYIEIGAGTASLASLSCTALDVTTTVATLDVTPTAVNGWIGSVTAAQMSNFGLEPTVGPATLFSLPGIVTVTARANAQVGDATPVLVPFSYSDIQARTVKSVSTTDFTAALFAGLLANSRLQISIVGLGLPGLGTTAIQSALAGIVAGAASPVDQLLNGVLQTLGVGIGQADTWINAAHCGAAVLAG